MKLMVTSIEAQSPTARQIMRAVDRVRSFTGFGEIRILVKNAAVVKVISQQSEDVPREDQAYD